MKHTNQNTPSVREFRSMKQPILEMLRKQNGARLSEVASFLFTTVTLPGGRMTREQCGRIAWRLLDKLCRDGIVVRQVNGKRARYVPIEANATPADSYDAALERERIELERERATTYPTIQPPCENGDCACHVAAVREHTPIVTVTEERSAMATALAFQIGTIDALTF